MSFQYQTGIFWTWKCILRTVKILSIRSVIHLRDLLTFIPRKDASGAHKKRVVVYSAQFLIMIYGLESLSLSGMRSHPWSSKEWFKAFCAAKPNGLKIHYTNYVDAKGIDEEVAKLLAESGCVSVFVGMETGDPKMLESMNKRSTLEDNMRAMELLQKYRIGVIAGVVVGVQGESKESLERTAEFLKKLTEFDNFDRFEWGSLIPFPGSKANRMLREHPDLKEKYKDFGNEDYLFQLVSMIQDWYRYYCEIDFNDILELQDRVVKEGLVPYEMTMFQRRSWSGTPAKVFRV